LRETWTDGKYLFAFAEAVWDFTLPTKNR
jgi:hypothetical protein